MPSRDFTSEDLFSSPMMSMHSSTHSSRMNTVGPAMSLRTSCWLLPQNVQWGVFLESLPPALLISEPRQDASRRRRYPAGQTKDMLLRRSFSASRRYRLFDLASQRGRHKRNVRTPYQRISSMIRMIATIVPIFSGSSHVPFLHVAFSGGEHRGRAGFDTRRRFQRRPADWGQITI